VPSASGSGTDAKTGPQDNLARSRTPARLYTLVGKTAGRVSAALERGQELLSLRAAHLGGPGRQVLAGASGAMTTEARRSKNILG
jgi:hypothetical protein